MNRRRATGDPAEQLAEAVQAGWPATPSGPSVASRLLAILAAFSHDNPARTLSQISRVTGIPLATTHRLIAELVEWGALERDEDGDYHIGLKLWELGVLAPRGMELREAAMPHLQEVYAATGENTMLAVRRGTEAVFIECISGPSSLRFVRQMLGRRMPMYATGVGLALLAHAPFETIEAVLTAPLHRYTDHTVNDPVRLRLLLDQTRRQGFAVCYRQITDSSASVAAPLFGPTGETVAALSIVGPASMDWRAVAPIVVTESRALSCALGAPNITDFASHPAPVKGESPG